MQANEPKCKEKFPMVIRNGSVSARIYETRKANGYTSFVLSYHVNGRRVVRFFKKLSTARQEARKTVDALASGEVVGLAFTAPERLAIERSMELLAPFRLPLDTAVGQFVEAREALSCAGVSVAEACRDYARRHASIIADVTVADAAAQLLAQIETEQAATTGGVRRKVAWLASLRVHLGKLTRAFECRVADVDGGMLTAWLAGLKGSERTRANVRAAVAYFLRWCKARRFIAPDVDPMADVPKPKRRRDGPVQVITAEQLAGLFEHAPDSHIPFLALKAFAGLRTSEAARLRWETIDLADGWVEIPESVAKQTEKDSVRRLVRICAPLGVWLRPHARRTGLVCDDPALMRTMRQLAKQAGVAMPKNALRHSWISARVTLTNDLNAVAVEAGNSPAIIRAHYWRRMRPEQAKAWFAVAPSVGAKVLPMRAERQ
jgi:integrase